MKHYKYLSQEFLSKYADKDPFDTEIGKITYTRTYSRYLPEEGRRETWLETVARAVDYNIGLETLSGNYSEDNFDDIIIEAEALFDNVFNLRQFLSGRTLWIGGTPIAYEYPMANFNCAFLIMDDARNFHELFYILMIGSGGGFRALPEDVSKMQEFRTDVNISFEDYYNYELEFLNSDLTEISFIDNEISITVGDSKEGWVEAVKIYFEVMTNPMYRSIDQIHFNFNLVRPRGERLKRFGGTASGHEPLKEFFEVAHEIITNSDGRLKPIDVVDINNKMGEVIVVGGVRRTSEMAGIGENDEDSINMKSNLYTQDENGEWTLDSSIAHRQMSNNSIYYYSKPSREQWHEHLMKMKKSGEPGWVNAEMGAKRRDNFNGTNPCFTGDTKLLTGDGYKRLDSLVDYEFDIVNYKGEVVKGGRAWYTGDKPTVKVKLSDGTEIKCTDNHVFMLSNGDECEAKDLKGKRIKRFLEPRPLNFINRFVQYGFIQGDGNLTRLKSENHKGLEVNIGKDDGDILKLFNLSYNGKRSYYINGFNDDLKKLGFESKVLPERGFPSTYDKWSDLEKLSFLRGLYSANGCVVNGVRISFKTTSKRLLIGLESALREFGIHSYVTRNKPKIVEFENGEYMCKESYDLNIGRADSMLIFKRTIGFEHSYKNDKLDELLQHKMNHVVSVKATGNVEAVYDFHEPSTHWGVIEGFIAHNCGEILLDSKGMCNLTEVVVMKFVENGVLDRLGLLVAQLNSARAGVRMTLPKLEIHDWDKIAKRDNLIGCSLTGWQDMVNATAMSHEDQVELLKDLRAVARVEAKLYAHKLGINEPVLKTTIKPSGTLSLLPTVSSGLHYSHSPYYIRRIRMSADDALAKSLMEQGFVWNPEVGQTVENMKTVVFDFPVKAPDGKTKSDVSAIEQLETYLMFMENYVDHNASITVHVRDDEWEEVEQFVWEHWDDMFGVSFLSYDDSFYDLLPYETISEFQYYDLLERTPAFDCTALNKYENGEDFEIDESGCENGVCPIR